MLVNFLGGIVILTAACHSVSEQFKVTEVESIKRPPSHEVNVRWSQ